MTLEQAPLTKTAFAAPTSTWRPQQVLADKAVQSALLESYSLVQPHFRERVSLRIEDLVAPVLADQFLPWHLGLTKEATNNLFAAV